MRLPFWRRVSLLLARRLAVTFLNEASAKNRCQTRDFRGRPLAAPRKEGVRRCSCRGGARPERAFPRASSMAFAVAACSDTPKPESELGRAASHSPATPGLGARFRRQRRRHRVLHDRQRRLVAGGQADAHESGALAAAVLAVHHHHRGPRRRARHPRVQHRPGREARPGGAQLSWPSTASTPSASARSPMARSGPSRCATTSPAGRRIAGPRPCSTAATKRGLSRTSANQSLAPMRAQSRRRQGKKAERGEHALMVAGKSWAASPWPSAALWHLMPR